MTSPDSDITVCSSHTTEDLEWNYIPAVSWQFEIFSNESRRPYLIKATLFNPVIVGASLENNHYLSIKVFVYFWVAPRKVWHYTQEQHIEHSTKNMMNEKKEKLFVEVSNANFSGDFTQLFATLLETRSCILLYLPITVSR